MKNKINIALFCISNGFSGAERVVYELTKNLSKLKQFNIYLIVNSEIVKYYLNLKNIFLCEIGKCLGNNLLSNRIIIRKPIKNLLNIIQNNKISLISTHMLLAPEFYYLFKKINIPYTITFHGDDIIYFISPRNLKEKLLMNSIWSTIIRDSSMNISVGKEQIQNLQEKYKSKTVVIPNGVDSKIFKPLNNIKQKKNVILFVGKFIESKGIKEIINVAKQLNQYEFWFAGQGELTNLINLPNTKNLGFKTTEELVKLYNQATICIFPSYIESFGLVGLEAMSCGRAVIATPLGFSEYIKNEKDGIIIPAKDENALKNAIVDLMTNEKKRKMLEKNARKKALKYSWDKVVKQYLKVFKDVIKENEK